MQQFGNEEQDSSSSSSSLSSSSGSSHPLSSDDVEFGVAGEELPSSSTPPNGLFSRTISATKGVISAIYWFLGFGGKG
jgi:hypothetical protein